MDQPKTSIVRLLAERLSRGLSFRRTLSTPKGRRRIIVTPEASLRYWLPGSLNSDVQLSDFASQFIKEGQKVWDIGANVGIFTHLAAALVGSGGRVLSVEADPFISQLLIRSGLRLPARDAHPEIVTAAVSSQFGLGDFVVPNRSRASNHLLASTGCTQTGGKRFTFKVPCVTLEWLLEHSFAPDIVKMDIEGMEHAALSAAPRLLREVRPIFHLEVWSEIAPQMGELLKASSYLMFDGELDLKLSNPIGAPVWCTIAVPQEKLGALRQAG